MCVIIYFFLFTHPHARTHTHTPAPRVITEELCACVTVFTRRGLVLAQEPDECGLSRASFSLSHLPFHSALTLVLTKRQGLTYIHPFNGNWNLHQPLPNKETWHPILVFFFFLPPNSHFLFVSCYVWGTSCIEGYNITPFIFFILFFLQHMKVEQLTSWLVSAAPTYLCALGHH